ncbi:MAG: HAD family hydrolase [Deltaproteobacteria bacterium]|nr:HAD family hydrolase [Deltaproteobacteria bacterium]
MQVGAFFDLDLTLLSVNSGALWFRRERRLGRLSRAQYARAVVYLLLYRANLLNMDEAMREALATIRGQSEETLRRLTEQWYEEEVAAHFAPGGVRAVEAHRRHGHRLVLLTSASSYEAELAAEQLGMDGWLSSTYEVRDGCFTGEPMFPICYGEGKVRHAERYAEEHGVDLARSYFYSDSASDLPMLRRVGEPRVVNPDVRLKWHARRKGWPILDWS